MKANGIALVPVLVALSACALPQDPASCTFTWSAAVRDQAILSAIPNVLHFATGPATSAEVTRDYDLDLPANISRTIGGNVVLVFRNRNEGLDTDELAATLDPCTMRLRDAHLIGSTVSVRRVINRQ